jgi:antitoxin ParD1/3/4
MPRRPPPGRRPALRGSNLDPITIPAYDESGSDGTAKENVMVVHLSDDLERLVQKKVESGRYRSPDEVISQALLALDEWDRELDARATAFKSEIEERLASGPAVPLDFSAVKKRIREEIEARKASPR